MVNGKMIKTKQNNNIKNHKHKINFFMLIIYVYALSEPQYKNGVE